MNKRTSTYIVLILFNLIYVSKGRACSDMLFTENFGTIDLRYTSFCPEYIDSDKLKELSDYLKSIEDETEVDVMILINRIPIKDSKNQFISLAIDTLREFDRTLAQDFNSFYTYQKLWRESELNSKKVPYLENIKYPMNISVSKQDSISKIGVKLIYNYQWDESHNSENSAYHTNRIKRLMNWAIRNTDTIKDIQTERIVDGEYNNWKFTVLSIPNSKIMELISDKMKRTNNHLWIGVTIVALILCSILTIKRRQQLTSDMR
jgi:hypothetical protein